MWASLLYASQLFRPFNPVVFFARVMKRTISNSSVVCFLVVSICGKGVRDAGERRLDETIVDGVVEALNSNSISLPCQYRHPMPAWASPSSAQSWSNVPGRSRPLQTSRTRFQPAGYRWRRARSLRDSIRITGTTITREVPWLQRVSAQKERELRVRDRWGVVWRFRCSRVGREDVGFPDPWYLT